MLEKKIMDYYRSSMPYCDRTDVSEETLLGFARHACFLRENVDWCRALPEDIFLENVAAYRINNERIEDCRQFFYDLVMPLLEGLSPEAAVLRVNDWCACQATYHLADARTANAMTVYKSGFGRCGEESTFAVTVLRSVGLAARQVYVPLWSHCDDNHAWVEVYCGGIWKYLGACEPEPVLNRGWFAMPASRAMLVHARSFGLLHPDDSLIARNGCASFYNVTPHYARTVRAEFTVMGPEGTPLAGLPIKLEVLNYGHYGTIATIPADENGRFCIRLGCGSLRVSCVREGELLCARTEVKGEGELCVTLTHVSEDVWTEYVFYAPRGGTPKTERISRDTGTGAEPAHISLDDGDVTEKRKESRERRLASYYQEERAAAFPEAARILRTAGGNFEEVMTFLEKDRNPYRIKLLKTLTQKDYYDLRAEVLEEHFVHAMAYAGRAEVPDEIFVSCVLNPRLELEELTCWRAELAQMFAEKREAFAERPERIWEEVCAGLKRPREDAYDTLRISPVNAAKSGKGSVWDRKNLFLAIARTFGIPARLAPLTGEAQYYRDGVFHTVGKTQKQQPEARLILRAEAGGSAWNDGTDFALNRLENGEYRHLWLHETQWQDDRLELRLVPGKYQLILPLRLKDGSQRVRELCFALEPGEREIRLVRPIENGQQEAARPLPPVVLGALTGEEGGAPLQTADEGISPTGDVGTLDALRGGQRAVCIWICEGEEPTEHILNEMLERIGEINEHQKEIFLISRRPPRASGTLERLLREAEGLRLYKTPDWNGAAAVARAMEAEENRYPLAVAVQEDGRGVYASCGYQVGAAAQLLAALQRR